MSRYLHQKVTNENEEYIKFEDDTAKAICNTVQKDCLLYSLPTRSINIEATESAGQPVAQLELREIKKAQREDYFIGKWLRVKIDNTQHN